MVTDVVKERAKTAIPYSGRLVLTLLLLAVYVFGRRLGLPGVDQQALLEMRIGRELSSVLMLGINPLITGFMLVELFSLVAAPGRRLRQLGSAGRATLNRAALIASLLLAAAQAAGIGKWMMATSGPGGSPIVAYPGFPFLLLTIVTLTAATAALFALCQFLSAYGIGNGFALVILTKQPVGALEKGSGEPEIL